MFKQNLPYKMLVVNKAIITNLDWLLVCFSNVLSNALLIHVHTKDYNKSGAGKCAPGYSFLGLLCMFCF
jgi:hypothetical protein